MIKYCKYMTKSTIDFASRNKRELQTAKEYGFDVFVLDKGYENLGSSIVDNFKVIRRKRIKYQQNIKGSLLKIINFFKEIKYMINIQSDIVSCHNIDALSICYIANLFKKSKFKLIYDSHEYELGLKKNEGKIKKFFVFHLERFLIKNSMFTIVVNQSIAERLIKNYNCESKIIVLRSTPYKWDLDKEEVEKTRSMYLDFFSEFKNPFIVLYHGGVMLYRGIEETLEAMKDNDFCFVIMGYPSSVEYKDSLINYIENNNLEKRVLLLNAVATTEMYKYISASDCGIAPITGKVLNYYLSLPNKILECVQSETPIICSDFPEMKKIVLDNDVGLLLNAINPKEIANKVREMASNKSSYKKYKENLKTLKTELCWENESKILINKLNEVLCGGQK